jgi:hypothetical protein
MSTEKLLGDYFEYGKTLVASGAKGIRGGSESYLEGRSLSAALSESARASLPFAAFGIGAGLLQAFSGKRSHRVTRSLAAGFAGATIGFLAAFSWKTRDLAESMAQDAMKNISTVRDAHWLENHPIDYA